MSERDILVSTLTGEVLGPRGGIRERLESPPHRAGEIVSPAEEYITGVLAPRDAHGAEEIDASDDLLGEQDEAADDQADSGAPAVPPGVTPTTGAGRSPSLDPRSRPCSIGLSILVEGSVPTLEVCATWAWYEQLNPTSWQREPRCELFNADCTRALSRSQTEPDNVRQVTIQVRSQRAGNAWRVSIFLINTTNVSRPGPEHHVYQPQVRLHLGEGTRLLPLDDSSPAGDDEAASLALLYSGRRAMARGHLCAAMWKEIDPERPFPTSRPQGAPFVWLDGAILPSGTASRFSPADARTELVPCYFIPTPRLDATERHGDVVLDPDRLSELWLADDLRRGLSPLADAYENWISLEQKRIPQIPGQHQQSATTHMAQCREVLRRIREGIDLLCSDTDVRLAFCFANKAIALQSTWTRQRVNPWRPFQLAFQLVNLTALRRDDSIDRLICDLLWVPTGGGKTEAYLGLAAFTFALRRLLAQQSGRSSAGLSVLSRYTLRLLTIQQFRRALSLVTACEYLRVTPSTSGVRGWRPQACPNRTDLLWSGSRFSIGLWVGGNVTPNNLFDFSYPLPNGAIERVPGALAILRGEQGESEPAQILHCPCCEEILAIPPDGFVRGRAVTMHFVCECQNLTVPLASPASFSGPPLQPAGGPLISVNSATLMTHSNRDFHTLTVTFTPGRDITPQDVDRWCTNQVLPIVGRRARLVPARASRPGYFLRDAPVRGGRPKDVDFEIFCPNPDCALNGTSWSESTPAGSGWIPAAFEISPGESSRAPIPACTVDDQVYQRCPTMVVATVDKFARLAFEPRAGALFGAVDHYCDRHGYYRAGCPPVLSLPQRQTDHPPAVAPISVEPFLPPDLILQDELHLIEGPLGSMVGLYETAVDTLASRMIGGHLRRPKYVASSATVRRATDQVQSLYDRRLSQFPPPGTNIDDSFFMESGEPHPLDASPPGRLYVGVCAPGRGAQTPIVRIWSSLLQQAEQRRLAGAQPDELDGFWTLIGYFNAIRELAGAVALARQDIPERMAFLSPTPRQYPEDEPMELSSRAGSLELPGMLERLGERLGAGSPVSAAACTSMFGTGVDVLRLGLMVVHGQPKTSSAYIQATGRVGRRNGGLVVAFYRASRPRDLSHYEFFTGYHRELYRHVEPTSVNPFSPRARDRALGPASVAILRQALELSDASGAVIPLQFPWRVQQRLQRGWFCRAADMAGAQNSAEIAVLADLFERRARRQPIGRKPGQGVVAAEENAEIARWAQLAALAGPGLLYYESSMVSPPTGMVVLGDLAHEVLGLPVAYENAPNSLREVESTTTFKGRP